MESVPQPDQALIPLTDADYRSVEQFIYREARFQDESCYDEWEALWDDDGIYWVPAGTDDPDPHAQISYIYDNRRRISSRIRQLKTGQRFAQNPASRLRRIVSNIEIELTGDNLLKVRSNFLLRELRHERIRDWCGATTHLLRRHPEGFRIVMKKVILIDNREALPTLAFLI